MAVGKSHLLTLQVTRPFCAPALLAYLRVRAISGVESLDGLCYRRTLRHKNSEGVLAVDLTNAEREGIATVQYSPSLEDQADALGEVVSRLIDASAPIDEIGEVMRQDPIIGPIARRYPGMRIPGTVDPFELAVRAILGQQISVRAAATLAGKIVSTWGKDLPAPESGLVRCFPKASHLVDVDLEKVGLSRAKASAVRDLATAVAQQQIDLSPVEAGEPAEQERLLAISGIGPWTAAYIALRGLCDRDSIPTNDLGLRSTLGAVSSDEVAVAAKRWRPWRGYGAIHLWSTYLPL